MLQISAVLFIVTLQQAVNTFDIKCNATKKHLTFTIKNVNTNINDISFYYKTPNPGDPWIFQEDCKLREKQLLECDNNRQNKGQNFRLDLSFTDGKNASKELWYFDCFTQHGVRAISVQNVTWNGFDIKWAHYTVDEDFMKQDEVSISMGGKTLLRQEVDNQQNAQVFNYRKGAEQTNYTVCVKTTFFSFATQTMGTERREMPGKCVTVKTKSKPEDKSSSTDLKTPLLAVGIGILCLVLLCLLFVIYNKKCKQGGDHDYDMNRDDALMGGEGAAAEGEGEELQVYKDPEANEKMLENGKHEEA